MLLPRTSCAANAHCIVQCTIYQALELPVRLQDSFWRTLNLLCDMWSGRYFLRDKLEGDRQPAAVA